MACDELGSKVHLLISIEVSLARIKAHLLNFQSLHSNCLISLSAAKCHELYGMHSSIHIFPDSAALLQQHGQLLVAAHHIHKVLPALHSQRMIYNRVLYVRD